MNYMIALDSGGTKTNTVVFDTTGHIHARDMAFGCNPLDIGPENSVSRITEIIRTGISLAPGPVTSVYAAVAGIYYYQGNLYRNVKPEDFGIQYLKFEPDGRCMLSSELSHQENGVGLICGTGCSIWLRTQGDGPLLRSGGWGYLLDTMGSGYILGRDALHAVCLAIDGRAPETMLQQIIEKDMGCDFLSGVPEVYAGGRRRIASFAYTVFEAAAQGDRVAREIMMCNAKHIADLIWWADPHLDEPYEVIAGGGIVTAFPEYVKAIQILSPPNATLRLAEAPPVYGAAVEAMHMAGYQVDDTFRKNFLADYARLEAVHD